MEPLVSVLMTCYNREEYISEAIDSVIASEFHNWELIICDDCSVDGTVAIARKYQSLDNRISVHVNKENLGDYMNRNQAAYYAKGKYLKYVDSDDYIFPRTLSVMVEQMEANPEAAFGITSPLRTFQAGMVQVHGPRSAYLHHFFKRNILGHGPTGVIIRSNIFFSSGGFSGKRNISDFELWLKLAARYPVVEMEHKLVYWREHAGQEIRVARHVYLEQLYNVIRQAFESEHCPLKQNEKNYILVNQKKITIANIVKHSRQRKSWRSFFSLLKLNQLGYVDLFCLPWYYVITSRKFFWNRKWDSWTERYT